MNIKPPLMLGLSIEINVAIALCSIALGWFGFALIVQTTILGVKAPHF